MDRLVLIYSCYNTYSYLFLYTGTSCIVKKRCIVFTNLSYAYVHMHCMFVATLVRVSTLQKWFVLTRACAPHADEEKESHQPRFDPA